MKAMHANKRLSMLTLCAAVGLAALLLISCNLILPWWDDSGRIVYAEEELSLVGIDDAQAYSRGMAKAASLASSDSRGVKAPKPEVLGSVSIKLIAEVSPPRDATGNPLQASHVWLTSDGKTALVAYMTKGAAVYGAVDVINLSNANRPNITSTLSFSDFDVAAVLEEAGIAYLAGRSAAPGESGGLAHVRAYELKKGVLSASPLAQITLPGYFATDLARQTGVLYVTTGAYDAADQPNVGLYALDPSTLTIKTGGYIATGLSSGLVDARSVKVSGSDVLVLNGSYASPSTTASIKRYANGNLSAPSATYSLSSYPTSPEAKSYLEVFTSKGKILPEPDFDPSVIPYEDQSSNSVSMGNTGAKNILYIANGEAGLWVGDADALASQSDAGADNIAGSIRFGLDESVNYVAGKNTVAVAAVGTGGLKVLTITAK
ncbi:MAG: hypothetical protein FD137_448 [Spirochaetes bacterium]|nr:MAG: hypothetical protein FD137_448 [Spirochaetota bacterium]